MASQHGMIEPFAPEQVRESNGHRIVSYGTSSYGYDARCANEFKIFTNINSTIVDPKRFDERSFVDFGGDVCIIPPNSFALARTVEYFRIPRQVLTVCLGKCVTGDTRVVDAETGAYVPITEMRFGKSTLAMDEWALKPAKVSAFVPQGRRPVYKLHTRTGLSIRATLNHPFRKPEGWVPLEQLRVGDRIAVAGRIPVFGKTPILDWEATLLGLMISEGQCHTPNHSPTFTSADPVRVRLLKDVMSASGMGEVTQQGNCRYRLVNRAGGALAQFNRIYKWLADYGLNVRAADKFVPQAIFTAPRPAVRLFLQALFGGDGGFGQPGNGCCLEYCSKSRRLLEDVHHLLLRFGVLSLIREKVTAIGTAACSIQITEREQIVRFAEQIGFVHGCQKQLRLDHEVLPLIRGRTRPGTTNFDTWPREACDLPDVIAQRAQVSLNSLHLHPAPDRSVAYGAVSRLALATQETSLAPPAEGPVWDSVEQIEYAGVEEVFDISVPKLHNFVANGMVVHNSTYARCGIICNVTPLEPEWEGHVTLEFSNTTPLPAKIYANEGVAQMLFFEADEVCSTSYRDRGGKYQGQRGVTLPKT